MTKEAAATLIDEANERLISHAGRAALAYARDLAQRGESDEAINRALAPYVRQLESWRSTSLRKIQQAIQLYLDNPSAPSVALH